MVGEQFVEKLPNEYSTDNLFEGVLAGEQLITFIC
jgi:hypothetical protein